MDNNNIKEISDNNQINTLMTDNNNIEEDNDKKLQKELNIFPSDNSEFVTKGRKTVCNSSLIHLESPKKENPSRSKRMSLLRKAGKDIKIDKENIELFSFGKKSINSNKNTNDGKNEENETLKYKLLIKRIATQLKRRIKLPSCKIIKIYQPYRELILKIAKGIRETAKDLNFNNFIKKKDSAKFSISLISKEAHYNSKKILLNSKTRKEYEENINSLLDIDDSTEDIIFMNNFDKFLQKNTIEILMDTKLPSFKNENNKYLLSNIYFWIKYIKYISIRYQNKLSFFNFMNLIELFYIWIDGNKSDPQIFNKLIIEKIELLFNKDEINKFLLTYKLNNLDEIFVKYEIMNNFEFREVKLSENCQCPNCQNIKKSVINYNKNNNYISYSEENNFGIVKEINKFPERKTIYDNKLKSFSIQINTNSKNYKITDYYRSSTEKRPLKNISPKKIIEYKGDKKIIDYFSFIKNKTAEEPKIEKKDKNNNSSNKNKNRKSINNNNKNMKSKHYTTDQILKLLNLKK